MIEIVDVNDSRAVRNKNNVLELYELMINEKSRRKLRRSSSAPRTFSITRSYQTVRSRSGSISARSRGNGRVPVLSYTRLLPLAIMCGLT
jgi:hypothetical protein